MMQGQDSPSRAPRRRSTQRANPASTGRRLKRNVLVGGRRTTIVLEAYVWDSIDSMLDREGVSLDAFCADVDDPAFIPAWHRQHGLSCLPISGCLNRSIARPLSIRNYSRWGARGRFARQQQPARQCRCCNWRSGALRKTKRVLNSLAGVGDTATRRCDAVMAVGP